MNKKQPILFVVLTICLSIGGLISTDIFLPAIKLMGSYYKVPEVRIQSAIAIFLFGISISQLIYGPLTDCLGRKRVLLIGLSIWLVSTIGIFFSVDINELLTLRLLQGIGACAGITISRAIISDIMNRESAAELYLTIFPFVGMSPAIAPMIGGVLSEYFGWKACFMFLTVFIVLTVALCVFTLQETLPENKRHSFSFSIVCRNMKSVLLNHEFLYYAAIPCFAYATYFAYLVESPFILTNLGLSEKYVGYTYVTLSLTYILGNISAKKISLRVGVDRAITKGYFIFCLGGAGFAAQMYFSPFPIITSVLTISILTFGNGFLLPLGTASAIASRAKLSGTASGVMGCLQLGCAALSSFVIGMISQHQATTTALLIAISGLLGFGVYLLGKLRKEEIIEVNGN